MRKVYICSPYNDGDIMQNYVAAKTYCKKCIETGELPIATHVYLPPLMQNGPIETESEREYAMSAALEFIGFCDVLRVYGSRISDGMKAEIEYAYENAIEVEFLCKTAEDAFWKGRKQNE